MPCPALHERESSCLVPCRRVQELSLAQQDVPHPFAATAIQDQMDDLLAEEQRILELETQAAQQLQTVEHITEFWTPM